MRRFTVDPDMPVDTLMRNWPATVRVFMKHQMLCIGCPIGPFHTVTDACLAHGVVEESFVNELEEAVNAPCALDGRAAWRPRLASRHADPSTADQARDAARDR